MSELVGWLLVILFFVIASMPPLLLVMAFRRRESGQTVDSTCTVVERREVNR